MLKIAVLFPLVFSAFPALAQSEQSGDYVGEQAARIFNSIMIPATRYSSADHTYVVFVKETDWVKCSAYSEGDVYVPTPAATYRCEMKAIVY